MKPFVINRHGRLVFPSNFLPELDFSVLQSLERLDAVIARDFEAKAPTGTDILERVEAGRHERRYDLIRDVALNLVWVNRYALTMYEKRPARWRDVPRRREDVFLPILTPWEEGERKVAAVRSAYDALPAGPDPEAEDRIFAILFDVFAHRPHHATELPAIKPTVAEILADPENLTFCLADYDPDYPVYGFEAIRDCREDVPELESLHRLAMVLHDQYPWERSGTSLKAVGALEDDDFVVVFAPRNPDVLDFIRRVKAGEPPPDRPAPPGEARAPVAPYPPVRVREQFAVMPRLEALSVVAGEHACTNEDLIRNGAYSWSPMTAEDIGRKTGIEARRYTERGLDEISLEAAEAALAAAGRSPEDVGAVIFCSCTSTRLIPSVATWLSGHLGIFQTHGSFDVIAACAGFPYGLAEATRLLQEVRRPVLVVCAEKFSDKIGSVRTSRMIFGDGAGAIVVGPADEGDPGDIEILQCYASGPCTEVNSIIWPNPEFDNDITVYGPEVRSLAGRYLVQMIGELRDLPHPDAGGRAGGSGGGGGSMLDAIDLVVPHQANKTMVTELACDAGLTADQLYFNIDRVGNVSAASIPLAIHDAVRDGVIDRPMRVFAPGFGAGAVGGYAVLRIDPAIVAEGPRGGDGAAGRGRGEDPATAGSSPADVWAAFGD
jgi:3-oxoacyl-[acyl-carrier-protein] synthase III